jgi:hypothetical protein
MVDFNLTPDSELHHLLHRARKAGVTMSLNRQSASLFELCWLHRAAFAPPGTGRIFLQQLCDLCDRRGIALDLGVDPDKPYLFDYYARLGFERLSLAAQARKKPFEIGSRLIPLRRQANSQAFAPEMPAEDLEENFETSEISMSRICA